MAESGEGRARDLTLAVSWYSKSAKQGFPLAQYRLGMAYAGGNGVDADPQLAVRWLKPAAQADHIRLGYRRYGIERHMIYFRITTYGIAVVRILHDRMDASRYLSI